MDRLSQTLFQPTFSAQNTHSAANGSISGIFTVQDRMTFPPRIATARLNPKVNVYALRIPLRVVDSLGRVSFRLQRTTRHGVVIGDRILHRSQVNISVCQNLIASRVPLIGALNSFRITAFIDGLQRPGSSRSANLLGQLPIWWEKCLKSAPYTSAVGLAIRPK